jgi:predicted metal-dependent peptidase
MTETSQRISKQVVRLVLDHPFFASLVMRMKFEEKQDIPTFCTDGRTIFYNSKFADSLTDPQIRGILCHEVLHPALGHLWRFRGKSLDIANQACDHAINLFIEEYNAATPASQRLELPDGGCCDPRFTGLSAEEIYTILDLEKEDDDSPSQPSPGEFSEPADSGDESGNDEIGSDERDWQIALEQATQVAKIQDKMPGGAEEQVRKRHKPEVDWTELLRRFVGKADNKDFSTEFPDRRYMEEDIVVETLYSQSVGDIVFAVDTSGSVSIKLLEKFMSEATDILNTVKPCRLRFIQCDSTVQEVKDYLPGEVVSTTVKGRGGTSFLPVFNHVRDAKLTPECLVYLTDGCGSFPDQQPPYPVLWLDYGGTQYPWGEVVRVNSL